MGPLLFFDLKRNFGLQTNIRIEGLKEHEEKTKGLETEHTGHVWGQMAC